MWGTFQYHTKLYHTECAFHPPLQMGAFRHGLVKLIEKVADRPIGVLITGESGTGKELAARTIHLNSTRSKKPFIDINCAALPESLLESELFGIEKGIATGVEKRVGKIESANSGTLFLDEIGDMSLSAQAKLLRVLQERKLERIGGRSAVEVDIRVIAATNKDLKNEISKGNFREDLYYRLNAVHIKMPSLREVREDIPLLAKHFLNNCANELGRGSMDFSSEALDCMVSYDWPGNVRELENEIKRAATLANSEIIKEKDLSEHVRSALSSEVLQYAPTAVEEIPQFLRETVEEIEIQRIKEALKRSGGNRQKAAKVLGITRTGLIYKIKKYGLSGETKFENLPQTKSIGESITPIKNHTPTPTPFKTDRQPVKQKDKGVEAEHKQPEAERRQLTVIFCDLVDFTTLLEQFDPEDLREIISAYQDVCSKVASRFEGHIVRYPGDVLLVYFGYPLAHEDDAQRAVKTGLEIIDAVRELPIPKTQLQPRSVLVEPLPLQVRVVIHTGPVVIGETGIKKTSEPIAMVGETPNIAARLLNVAEPNTVVVSSDTYRQVEGMFEFRDLGPHPIKGVSTPLNVYRVLRESGVRNRFEAVVTKGLTPLVGREKEVGLLLERWERVKEGMGQVVLLCGEPGIGKSRLVQVLKDRMAGESHTQIESRCSPYYQNSALYPVIDHLQRLLFRREDSPEEKLGKLEEALEQYGFSLQEMVPLFASLLSLPLPSNYPPLSLTPQRQKQKTLEALLAWLHKEAEKQPVLRIVEDLHWVDPSTLEYINLLVEQVPTARVFNLLTFRPDFSPPWTGSAHLTQIMVNRLARKEVEAMVEKVAGDKALPAGVVQQLVAKTDGVPLFAEELTKMVLESGLLMEREGHYELMVPQSLPHSFPLAIPATLHDSLMARLDRLGTVKEVAQLGAILGREFSYELLKAISPLDETTLQRDLAKLVEAELLYQRGLPPQARYFFKHALIQEAAYQSLLKSRRQEYHNKIAQVLEEKFPETAETQPELLAHHYTEASLVEQSIPYWQRAGQRAVERSANVEAINYLRKGLDLLKTMPDTSERAQQELMLQIALGVPLVVTTSNAAPEVEKIYARARELCQRLGETPQLFPVLFGLLRFYVARGELQTARELAEQLLSIAQRERDPVLLLGAYQTLGFTSFLRGELVSARAHLEQAISLYDPQKHRSLCQLWGEDTKVFCLSSLDLVLWLLGYLDQAMKRCREALTWAEELSHFFSSCVARWAAAIFYQLTRKEQLVLEQAEIMIRFGNEHGFNQMLAMGNIMLGKALTEQGQKEEGIALIRQGMAACQAMGAGAHWPYWFALLAEAFGKVGQIEEALDLLAEALSAAHMSAERWYEAEIYRLKGELLLALSAENRIDAEACFRQSIEVARRQSAKSLELRAVMSLTSLLQKRGKKEEARQMLSDIYGWFTEGFDTRDLNEAKALLEELSGEPIVKNKE